MLISCNKVPNKKKSALRKKASHFAFTVCSSVSQISTEDWNAVVPFGSEFLKLPFLTVLEKEKPANMHFHYAVIYDAGKPAAIAYFQVVDFTAEAFNSLISQENSEPSCAITAYIKKHVTSHLILGANKMTIRLLICGNAHVSGEHGMAFSPAANKLEVIDALADVIYRIGTIEKLRGRIAAILIKDFYASSLDYARELEEYKYHDFLVEPNMIVQIKWNSFEEYLNSMSKKYRNRAKGILKKGEGIERKNFDAAAIMANADKIQKLYDNVHQKADFSLVSLTIPYFAELKRTLADDFIFTAYYHGTDLIGFRTSLILMDAIEAHFIGLNYEVNKTLELYQNMLYDYVQEAIQNNKNKLFLGRTASEIKSTVGAEAHQLTCYIRHRNSLSNRIIKPFVDFLKPSGWVPRSPFKEAAHPEIIQKV